MSDKLDSNRKVLQQTISADLFGDGGLCEPAEIEVPEKYELLECLGRGGFGVVYKARDKVLDRFVALKFLLDSRPADVERFRREARFSARLNDPSIVQVYEFGQCADQPYIAMQFIDGVNLAEAELDVDGIVRAIRQAALALQHAHAEGVVHRDFKPANVLLDADRRVYLTDFGIARDVSGSIGDTLSNWGAAIGTPALMPPEQARGDLHAIDARSDIYALGASLYYLLCRRYPFEHKNLVELLHAVLHDEPPLPRSINASVPRALEAVILRCMRKERGRRYASMLDVVADLDAFLDGQSVPAESSEWFRKLVGVPATVTAETDLFETVGMEAIREIAAWDANLYRVSKSITRFHPQLDALIARLAAILENHPDFAWARFYRGVALFRRGMFDLALDEMERSIDRLANRASAQFEMGRLYLTLYLREQSRAYQHVTARGVSQHLAAFRGRLRQAEVCFDQTRRLKQGVSDWQLDYAQAVARLADGEHRGCVEVCDRILADDGDLEDVWRLRGDALRFANLDPFESYDQAIRVRRSDYEAYLGKAQAYCDLGRAGEARECLDHALEIYPDHVFALALLGRSFLVEAQAEDIDEDAALALVEEGLEHADRARTIDAGSYDAVVASAELLLQGARLKADPSRIHGALAALELARDLPGCQNRVNYLTASALLLRSRARRERGEDPALDLERVLRYPDENDQLEVFKHPPWSDLLEVASTELEAWCRINPGRPGST